MKVLFEYSAFYMVLSTSMSLAFDLSSFFLFSLFYLSLFSLQDKTILASYAYKLPLLITQKHLLLISY